MMLGTLVKSVFTLQPGYSLRALNNKYKLMLQIARQWPELNGFMQRITAALGEQGVRRLGVDCIGVVQWPYLSKCWEAPQRLAVVASHYEVLAGEFPALLLLERDESLTLCDLASHSPGCRLVLDRPIIDKTGLKGNFDFDLAWRPDGTQFGGQGGPDRGDPWRACTRRRRAATTPWRWRA